MNWLSWLLLAGSCLVSGAIGWTLRGWRYELAEFAAEQQRDDEWDRVHGTGGGS